MKMTSRPAKRLTKAARREQLLDVALEIVADRGADALTLGVLAERAGVSKPIAYEHFGTRAGLLAALFRRIDERQVATLRSALARSPRSLPDVARVLSTAYMDCYMAVGAEWQAISAALQGDEATAAVQQELLDGYVALYREALAPFAACTPAALQVRSAGLVGAAEAIAREMGRGRASRRAATLALAALIECGVRDAGRT
jgi:AcrR family transcriptional regulator